MGATTWSRILRQAHGDLLVQDLGEYPGGNVAVNVDVLVTNNTAAATSRIGPTLARCPRPPVLVVMHTAPGGVVADSRAHLRMVKPHITARLDVAHQRPWLQMNSPPGDKVSPKLAKHLNGALSKFWAALSQMYAAPAQPASQHAPAPGVRLPAAVNRPSTVPSPVPSAVPVSVPMPAQPRAGPMPRWMPPARGAPPQHVAHQRGRQGG